jgi:hypothetical protein
MSGPLATKLHRKQNVRVRIVRQPAGNVEGLAVRAYVVGGVYDIAASVAEYLITHGFAIMEMRTSDTLPPDTPDRRKQSPKIIA